MAPGLDNRRWSESYWPRSRARRPPADRLRKHDTRPMTLLSRRLSQLQPASSDRPPGGRPTCIPCNGVLNRAEIAQVGLMESVVRDIAARTRRPRAPKAAAAGRARTRRMRRSGSSGHTPRCRSGRTRRSQELASAQTWFDKRPVTKDGRRKTVRTAVLGLFRPRSYFRNALPLRPFLPRNRARRPSSASICRKRLPLGPVALSRTVPQFRPTQ